MSKIYPKFIANALNAVIGDGPPAAGAASLFFYALTDDYVYSADHESLGDINVSWRIAKSVQVSGSISAVGAVTVAPMMDAFDGAELTNVNSMVLVSEWPDSTSRLVMFLDSWTDTGLPFTAPAQVNLSWTNDFVFRLGSVAPAA